VIPEEAALLEERAFALLDPESDRHDPEDVRDCAAALVVLVRGLVQLGAAHGMSDPVGAVLAGAVRELRERR
jgi:hypothetical protein